MSARSTVPRDSLPDQSDALWVCYRCEMIGGSDEAERHVERTNHRVDQLDQATSDTIREEWKANRLSHVAALVAVASDQKLSDPKEDR
jgi:hypothetical protein